MWLLLERTSYGKRLFAVGVNRETAALSGVRVPLTVVATYTLSGLLSALGGVMLLGFTQNVFLNLGSPYLFPSVAAVVVGGTVLAGGKGSYWGTMAGALVLTLLTSLLTASQLPEAVRQIVFGLILLVLLSVYGRQRSLRRGNLHYLPGTPFTTSSHPAPILESTNNKPTGQPVTRSSERSTTCFARECWPRWWR